MKTFDVVTLTQFPSSFARDSQTHLEVSEQLPIGFSGCWFQLAGTTANLFPVRQCFCTCKLVICNSLLLSKPKGPSYGVQCV